MNISHIRLLNQQLVNPQFSDIHDMVSWMGMLQAQEYQMMRWAAAMRIKRPNMKAFRNAFDSGSIVRTHLFRCTWQLVTAEDLRWMLKLCADKNRTAINGYLAYHGRKLSEKEYQHANTLIQESLPAHASLPKDELLKALAERGLTDDVHTMSIYLRRAEIDGIICSGTLDDKQNNYALIDGRIPSASEPTREEAIALLARKYFRSHSPATFNDFAWWTNLNTTDCRTAIENIRNELTEVRVEDTIYYIHSDSLTKGYRKQTILLPSYDEYLIGYKSRHHAIADEFRPKAFSNHGIFYPVIAHDGKIIGNWHPKDKKREFFFREEDCQDITTLLERYRDFLKSE